MSTVTAETNASTPAATEEAPTMTELIEAIRAAVATGAPPEQKALGAQACRTILAALGAEAGRPIALPGAPQRHPLAGITADQALALLIARLTAVAEARDAAAAAAASSAGAAGSPPSPRPVTAPRIAYVTPPSAIKSPAGAAPGRRGPR
jgi:hypothetical protein